MSKSIKSWLIIAVSLVAIGLIAFGAAMAAYSWDFTKLSAGKYATNTYEVNGAFDGISIDVDTTEVEFAPSDDERCRIVCLESEKVKHSASVQGGTLVIETVNTLKWYDYIRFSFGTPQITVYLPESEYASLSIDTDTGDIAIPEDFTFEYLRIEGDTADVVCMASVLNTIEIKLSTGDIKADGITAGELELTTSTGNININSVAADGNITVGTATGTVMLNGVTCANFSAESDTGDITLTNVVGEGCFSIENDTGDVRFENSDALELSVKTSTGDVAGTLLSEKVFITETSTGNISVPKTITGGKCEITTSTGDIDIRIIEKEGLNSSDFSHRRACRFRQQPGIPFV